MKSKARPAHAPGELARTLAAILPEDRVRELARKTGLIRRERKIDPVAMVWVLVLGFGVRLQRTLAGLKREYEFETLTDLSDGSWYERFTPELVAFLRECVSLGIERLAAEASGKLGERLKGFKDLMIQDSTVIRLHEKLAKIFPATRARKVAAGVKVSLLISAVANGPKKVAIFGERTPEAHTLRVGPWVKDRILLVDLGFYKFQLFARIAENGGYFITRLKDNANPLLVASHTVHRGRAIELAGKRWQEVVPRLARDVLDAEVEIAFSRRRYKGKASGDALRVRLVAVWNEEAREYHTYLTNLAPDVLDAKEVADLYAVRWDIELVFKELKSRYALDEIPSANKQVVAALIWTAILTLLVSRRLYNYVRSRTAMKDRARMTQLRWATVFVQWAPRIMVRMMRHLGFARTVEDVEALEDEVLQSHALDPHIQRERLKAGWIA
jgi:putative transposase